MSRSVILTLNAEHSQYKGKKIVAIGNKGYGEHLRC